MNTHTEPVNKQASIFLSRKKRVDSIKEAIEIFATKLLSPEVADDIKSMMACNQSGEDVGLTLTLRVRRDLRTADQYVVSFDSRLSKEVSRQEYYGLR
jgi:hypothetical protein